MNRADLNKLRMDGAAPIVKSTTRFPISRRTGKFIKGPIPLDWIIKAGRCKGRAFHVGMMLWYLSGLNKSITIKLSNKLPKSFGFDRTTKLRGLRELEGSGLVSVEQKRGRSPLVTILDCGESNA